MKGDFIPLWTSAGVLPPVDVIEPTSQARSPYRITLTDLVLRFATSVDRCRILDGLLRYRKALHSAGLSKGFQWVDGSFLENVELIRGRSPGDIDVVTFFELPSGTTEFDLDREHPNLFDHAFVKATYFVDSYPQNLDTPPNELVWWSSYWYGVWSHQRDSLLWKGFLSIDLDIADDLDASLQLVKLTKEVESS